MVLVNNTEFIIYDLDDDISIKQRIAANMNTLPKFLYFISPFETDNPSYNIEIIDILKLIKNQPFDFKKTYENLLPYLSEHIDPIYDIVFPWIIYNRELQTIPKDYIISLLLEQQSSIKSIIDSNIDIARFYQDESQKFRDDLEKEIQINKNNNNRLRDMFVLFANQSNPAQYTNFEVSRISLILSSKNSTKNLSLLELFDYIKLNKTLPFCTTNNYYKFLRDFIPFNNWNISDNEVIILKVLQTGGNNEVEFKSSRNYYDSLISLDKGVVKINIEIEYKIGIIPKEDIINRVIDVLGKNINDYTEMEDNINGVFYIPNQSMNKDIFADLVLNDPIFSMLMSIDESKKASKEKSGLFIYFNSSKIGDVRATFTEKYRQKTDLTMRNKDLTLFPYDKPYIRIKITRAKNNESIKLFQYIISKLFSLYNSLSPSIITEYKKYIKNFGDKKKLKQTPQQYKLKDIIPELFEGGLYPRYCEYLPRIVPESEAKEIGNYIIFPKTPEEGPQNYYVCDQHEDKKYPGLRENPYTKSKYTYVPCCYKYNQKDIKYSKYRQYYLGENKQEQDSSVSQRIIITNKILHEGNIGVLPDNIRKLFDIIEPNINIGFYRKGVKRTKNSFLECIVIATDAHSKNIQKNKKNLIKIARETGICRQEMYDSTPNEIGSILEKDTYMDPRLFIHLLEYVYKCNIFIFSRISSIDGEMIIPRHIQSYLKRKNNLPSVLIFEHMGGESDNAEYPQCELICLQDGDVDSYLFPYNNKISTTCFRVFNDLNKFYVLDSLIQFVDFQWNNEIQIIGQQLDSFGKCRLLMITYENNKYTISTSPMVPLSVKEYEYINILYFPLDIALNFISKLGSTIEHQIIINNKSIELVIIVGNVKVGIPVNSVSVLNIQILNDKSSFIEDKVSDLVIYNKNKKLALYLSEYMFWLFSNFVFENEADINDDVISSFIEENITIVPDFIYGHVNKNFIKNAPEIMKNNKLVVHDIETLKKLVYVLRLNIIRNLNKIKDYYTRDIIEGYFSDITDFTIYPSQILLYGEETLAKWILEKQIEHNTISNSILIDVNLPYFFKNILINNKLYLAQNTDTISNAFNIAKKWYINGYNINNDFENANDISFSLFSYASSTNIKEYYVRTKDMAEYNVIIVGYKIKVDDYLTPRFTILLEL